MRARHLVKVESDSSFIDSRLRGAWGFEVDIIVASLPAFDSENINGDLLEISKITDLGRTRACGSFAVARSTALAPSRRSRPFWDGFKYGRLNWAGSAPAVNWS